MEPHIESFIAKVAETFGDDDDARAIVAVSAMVGALAISRVLTGLEAVRRRVAHGARRHRGDGIGRMILPRRGQL